jgi:hypothetical protein
MKKLLKSLWIIILGILFCMYLLISKKARKDIICDEIKR